MLKNVSMARAGNFNTRGKPTPTRLNAMHNPIVGFFGVYPVVDFSFKLEWAYVAATDDYAPTRQSKPTLVSCLSLVPLGLHTKRGAQPHKAFT